MEDKGGYLELGDLIYRVISKYIASEKVPKSFGISQKLHPSEIHTLYAIGKNPNTNVTDLAKFLGITKGAVPKMIKKLKSKGLVDSFGSSANRKEVLLRLTAEGEKAYQGYLQYHEQRNAFLKKHYERLTTDEYALLKRALNALERYADLILEE
ncbi:MAG TPA: MarR family transcriptional regulator [Syntrophorhabdaceae bacterium]|mgnify:CR=1 FL=1|nr:MarR family transcriptional regulator [Syntrophorhabdaceae bacterium]HPA07205.1 MarR family transcriptional regulator [Methanoregulaceae archaeon]